MDSIKWGTPQQEAQEPCQACIALARTVMLDQVSFDRKPDCYGIRQITDDEGIEEWEDIRTSPDVAREEANDMMAAIRGEIYEVVPLWTTPQPTQAQQARAVPLDEARRMFDAGWKAAARFCDREDVVADGIIGFGACPQFEAAFAAAHGIKGDQHGAE